MKALSQAAMLLFTIAMIETVASKAKADDYVYSNWDDIVVMGPAGSQYRAVANFNANGGRAYFCQLFGFFNCQIQPPNNTWKRARIECWNANLTSGIYKYSDWVQGSQDAQTPQCSGANPNPRNPRTSVASTFYTSYTYP